MIAFDVVCSRPYSLRAGAAARDRQGSQPLCPVTDYEGVLEPVLAQFQHSSFVQPTASYDCLPSQPYAGCEDKTHQVLDVPSNTNSVVHFLHNSDYYNSRWIYSLHF